MNLTFAASGPGGHTVVTCEGTKVLVNYHKTDPKERGMIEKLVEKGLGLGLVLHHSRKGVVGEALKNVVEVLMDAKGEIALVGTKEAVEELAYDVVEAEIRNNRVVAEAQEDGSWKVLRLGDFKKDVPKTGELAKTGSKDDLPEPVAEEPAKAPEKTEDADKKRAVSSHEKVGGG